MKLIECYIESFGKLENFKYSFSDGINTIKADNGYGKTTLTAFIKAMLYGLEDTRRTSVAENDRKHYTPWGNTAFGGYLVFENNDKKYRVERRFSQKASDDTFALYEHKSGRESDDFTEKLGEELFGIDADGFERTVFLSEYNISGKNDNKRISAKLSNLVGTPGDLSVMDDAIELLEKKRKIYYKRGGAGEIEETRARLRECELEISELHTVRERCEEIERKLKDTRLALEGVKAKRRTIAREQELQNERKLKRTYEKQFLDMANEYGAEQERCDVLFSYFDKKMPTDEEIDTAERAYYEAIRLREANKNSKIAREYGELCDFFRAGTSDEEIEGVENLVTDLRVRAAALAEAPKNEDASSTIFKGEIPTSSEARSHIEKINDRDEKAGTKKTLIFFFASALLIIMGAVFGALIHAALYSISAIGVMLSVTSVLLLKDKATTKAIREAQEFVTRICVDSHTGEPLTKTLNLIIAECERIERIKEQNARNDRNAERIIAEIDDLRHKIDSFLGRFSLAPSQDRISAIAEIKHRYSLYKIISKNEAERISILEENEKKAATLWEFATEFLSLFRVNSRDPFVEIRTRLTEYRSISKSAERMKTSLIAFMKEHNIDPNSVNEAEDKPEPELPSIYSLDDEISELENKVGFYENQCKTGANALERLDELYAEKAILADREAEYVGALDIIQKTKKYLEEAKELLTSRYLAKTKGAFDSYVELIAKETGEDFTMDTSFVIKKNDKGQLRSVENYSRGTRELYALAERLALVDSLYENERPFLILDDPFAYFDDTRLATVRELIKKLSARWQIIYLTCTESRNIK